LLNHSTIFTLVNDKNKRFNNGGRFRHNSTISYAIISLNDGGIIICYCMLLRVIHLWIITLKLVILFNFSEINPVTNENTIKSKIPALEQLMNVITTFRKKSKTGKLHVFEYSFVLHVRKLWIIFLLIEIKRFLVNEKRKIFIEQFLSTRD